MLALDRLAEGGDGCAVSAAARTARKASSSCATGTPKTAMTASPMNFSIVPPWPSIARRAAPK